jgi:hypothetical protein
MAGADKRRGVKYVSEFMDGGQKSNFMEAVVEISCF